MDFRLSAINESQLPSLPAIPGILSFPPCSAAPVFSLGPSGPD
jgi:hypothetical protein